MRIATKAALAQTRRPRPLKRIATPTVAFARSVVLMLAVVATAVSFVRVRRPAQFAAIGAGCAVIQLGLLIAFTQRTELASASNAVAFLISAQLNFALNGAFTWRDRMQRRPMALAAQVLGFNTLTLVAVVFNQAIYLLGLRFAPYLVAGVIGIGATTLAKYFIADGWIFRTRKHTLGATGRPPISNVATGEASRAKR